MDNSHAANRAKRRKAQRLIEQGRFQPASLLLIEVCRARRDDVDAWCSLAQAYRGMRQFSDVEQCCRRILELNPQEHATWVLLGRALDVLGRPAEAVAALEHAVAQGSGSADAEVCHLLGNALIGCGRRSEAIARYRQAIRLRPDYFEALNNLASVLRADGQIEEALDLLARAHALRPEQSLPLQTLAMAHLALAQHDAARLAAERAVVLAPDDANAHRVLANVHYHGYRFDAALESFDRALAAAPDQPALIAGKAAILERRGELEAAQALIAPWMKAAAVPPPIALIFAKLAPIGTQAATAIGLLERLLARPDVDPQFAIDCHYELGRLHDAGGDYERAFEHFAAANAAQRRLRSGAVHDLDASTVRQLVETTLSQCDRGFWEQISGHGLESTRPIFVLGMPRSGTTLIEQILSSHPDVRGAGELETLPALAQTIAAADGAGRSYPACLAGLSALDVKCYAQQYLDRLGALDAQAARVVDKLPHNFLHLGLLATLLPQAQVIHTRRDARDTCLSIFFTKFNQRTPFASDLAALGRHYRQYERLMRHWYEVLDKSVSVVDYEQLIADQETHTRRLLDVCGLTWAPQCLHFEDTRRDVDSPSYRQVREPLYQHAVGRWRHYERYLTPLFEALDAG